MTHHDEVKVKVAMPEVLGLFVVAYIAAMVGFVMLDFGAGPDQLGMIAGFLPYAALLFAIVTAACYFNENMFGTALFGVLALFFYGFVPVYASMFAVSPPDFALYVLFGAVFLIVMAAVSLAQPVKMVTGVILLAGITFLALGVGVWMETESLEWVVGIFGLLTAILSFYLPVAIMFNTMKNENVLPIK